MTEKELIEWCGTHSVTEFVELKKRYWAAQCGKSSSQ